MDRLDLPVDNSTAAAEAPAEATNDPITTKKKFVAPEISVPVDVLEATTFFQAVTSGATN